MDTTAIIAILAVIATIATAIAAAAGAALSVLRKEQRPAPETSALSSEGAHVHTFLIASKEETAGRALNVYRCAQCGQIERRQAN